MTDSTPALPSLELSLTFQRKSLSLDVNFALTQPWTCLFGASGSGKSTILRMIAGFERPGSGRILVRRHGLGPGQTVLFDSGARVALPQHRRPVRILSQQAWLFPGTVLRNVAYGIQGRDRSAQARSILERLGLGSLEAAEVQNLSGGERQRVAIARTVAAAIFTRSGDPALLLLDEPFTGMDAALRDELALNLRPLLAEHKVPVLSVTHDVGEVFLLGAEVIRLRAGRIVDQGPPARVLGEERRRLQHLLEQPPASPLHSV